MKYITKYCSHKLVYIFVILVVVFGAFIVHNIFRQSTSIIEPLSSSNSHLPSNFDLQCSACNINSAKVKPHTPADISLPPKTPPPKTPPPKTPPPKTPPPKTPPPKTPPPKTPPPKTPPPKTPPPTPPPPTRSGPPWALLGKGSCTSEGASWVKSKEECLKAAKTIGVPDFMIKKISANSYPNTAPYCVLSYDGETWPGHKAEGYSLIYNTAVEEGGYRDVSAMLQAPCSIPNPGGMGDQCLCVGPLKKGAVPGKFTPPPPPPKPQCQINQKGKLRNARAYSDVTGKPIPGINLYITPAQAHAADLCEAYNSPLAHQDPSACNAHPCCEWLDRPMEGSGHPARPPGCWGKIDLSGNKQCGIGKGYTITPITIGDNYTSGDFNTLQEYCNQETTEKDCVSTGSHWCNLGAAGADCNDVNNRWCKWVPS